MVEKSQQPSIVAKILETFMCLDSDTGSSKQEIWKAYKAKGVSTKYRDFLKVLNKIITDN